LLLQPLVSNVHTQTSRGASNQSATTAAVAATYGMYKGVCIKWQTNDTKTLRHTTLHTDKTSAALKTKLFYTALGYSYH
jgi:hypothetical protein